jgi:hypothetical protein
MAGTSPAMTIPRPPENWRRLRPRGMQLAMTGPCRTGSVALNSPRVARPPVDPLPRRLGVLELLAPPAVAAVVDELPRLVEIIARRVPGVVRGPVRDEPEQPRAMEMNVGQIEPHRPALGDFQSLVEVLDGLIDALQTLVIFCTSASQKAFPLFDGWVLMQSTE